MKKFDIPTYYRSPIISKVKAKRKLDDPRKKDFSPTRLKFENVEFIISRHFGFCYGVENAIEKSYRAIQENPHKRIFLLSEMIHNPEVNRDLLEQGVRFIQDTHGTQLIPWDEINSDDIVIIPAFGTTTEIFQLLEQKSIGVDHFNTTCPFVEKVWNRSLTLGASQHTVIIHGKHQHEETKATFSHSSEQAPSIVVKDMEETTFLSDYILGKHSDSDLLSYFEGKTSPGFNPASDLIKIGVVNQTTMLASETQDIADHLRLAMIDKYGNETIKEHFADTRDTLCYATNDNQSATLELLNTDADLAIVVGGYNSSNTSHLVELLEQKFTTYFINNADEIAPESTIHSFNLHTRQMETVESFIPDQDLRRIIITSGASCPDSVVDGVMQKILHVLGVKYSIEQIDL